LNLIDLILKRPNFHCDFLKVFWRGRNVLASQEYNFFFIGSIEKKLCYPKRFFLVVLAATSTPKTFPKSIEFFFLVE
jgi:hypothetical protein